MDKNLEDITSKQWFLLESLDYFEEAPTLKELSKRLDYSHQNTKQILNKLEEKGFIKLEIDEKDKRYLRIYPTEKSQKWRENNNKKASEFMDYLYKEVSEKDKKIVSDFLNSFYERLVILDEKD